MKLVSIACALALASTSALAADTMIVKTDGGLLQGFTKNVLGSPERVEVFLGVPFAAPPVGANRWVSAQPVKTWEGIKSADIAPQPCKQKNVGSEDCLYVNIYRPAGTKPGDKLAVGVYAHGGANIVGDATRQDGSRMASENNVIIVTAQYRMGAFGFLSLPGMDASAGNFGITDTEAALAWVRKNIGAFGGNPDNVTLMSESAGSTNACRILVDPKAKGLVKGVMLQSEDCIHDVDTPAQNAERGAKFLKLTGCDSAQDPLACLRKKPSDELASASAKIGWWNPVSETSAVSEIRKGNWIKVPVLSGSNKEEGRSAGAAYVGWGESEYKAWVKKLVGPNADTALKLYPISSHPGKYALEYTMGDFITDSGMRGLGGCTNMQLAAALAKDAPAFIYTFEDSTVPTNRRFPDYEPAASHASELTYLFPDAGYYRNLAQKMTPAQKTLAKEMRAYWANFLKHQDPNGGNLAKWDAYKGDGSLMALRLDGKSQTLPASYFNKLHKCDFWNSIPVVLDRGDR